MADGNEVDELYEVAEDWEADVLDALRRRAGLVWECEGDGQRPCWTNLATATACEHCGRARPAGSAQGAVAAGGG